MWNLDCCRKAPQLPIAVFRRKRKHASEAQPAEIRHGDKFDSRQEPPSCWERTVLRPRRSAGHCVAARNQSVLFLTGPSLDDEETLGFFTRPFFLFCLSKC